ncbi:DUF932 domain-containing protein [Xanthomonas codiaei]|uniref:DUF932 domain-containing protein n=3 Tax=Xanthomonas codiaei TaxID=56463 RepID=A0A2S7CD76_9XANT|nr:DUF932 domain-containing protein [Xanthomonas codiaei]PPU59463.1 hypothetical protein XcodCFBP4690_19460 [Xanthomonas codiaei]
MHLVESMAHKGQTPWHGLGNKLGKRQPIEVWKRQSGMEWEIKESEVRYTKQGRSSDGTAAFPEQKVLYRSDTQAPLAVVSKRFQVVQPGEILQFYRDLTALHRIELETAGVLRGGRKFWALVKTGQSTALKRRDRVDGYLLLATACDGTLATTAQFTSVRVVCNNTLQIAVDQSAGAIKVPHRSQFQPDAIKRQLGIVVGGWDGFVDRMKALCDVPVRPDSVEGLLRRVLVYGGSTPGSAVVNEQAVARVRALYESAGRGATLTSSRGTAWGVLNSLTEYVDHHRRAHSDDNRRDAAWFGLGADATISG